MVGGRQKAAFFARMWQQFRHATVQLPIFPAGVTHINSGGDVKPLSVQGIFLSVPRSGSAGEWPRDNFPVFPRIAGSAT